MRNEYKISGSLQFITNILESRATKKKKTLLGSQLQGNKKKRSFKLSKQFISIEYNNIFVYSLIKPEAEIDIIYLHGGAYVLGLNKTHLSFTNKLHKKSNANIHIIDYPLAPESKVFDTIPNVLTTIRELIAAFSITSLYLMGDSAGGGMCIPLSLALHKETSIIKGHFLLSPWLDVSMSNKDLEFTAHNDAVLSIEELKYCGNLYSNRQPHHIDASPVYNDCAHLSPIVIFGGTKDLLYPDMLLFYNRNKNTSLHIYKEAPHVFMLFPFIKEQKDVISIVVEQIIEDQSKDI